MMMDSYETSLGTLREVGFEYVTWLFNLLVTGPSAYSGH